MRKKFSKLFYPVNLSAHVHGQSNQPISNGGKLSGNKKRFFNTWHTVLRNSISLLALERWILYLIFDSARCGWKTMGAKGERHGSVFSYPKSPDFSFSRVMSIKSHSLGWLHRMEMRKFYSPVYDNIRGAGWVIKIIKIYLKVVAILLCRN